MTKVRTPEQVEKAAQTRAVTRRLSLLFSAAMLIAKRAGAIELHAAKNAAASYEKGASRKLTHATDLRRIATFLADPRFHQLIREDGRLLDLLMSEPVPVPGNDLMRPRRIDPTLVTPTQPRRRRESYDEAYDYDY